MRRSDVARDILQSTAVFYRSAPHFVVEAVENFGPNVIGFQLATGARRWYIVGVYLAPEDTRPMERVSEAIRSKSRGAELLVAGDFNIDFAAPEGDRRAEDIATALATEGWKTWRGTSCHGIPDGVGTGGRGG